MTLFCLLPPQKKCLTIIRPIFHSHVHELLTTFELYHSSFSPVCHSFLMLKNIKTLIVLYKVFCLSSIFEYYSNHNDESFTLEFSFVTCVKVLLLTSFKRNTEELCHLHIIVRVPIALYWIQSEFWFL